MNGTVAKVVGGTLHSTVNRGRSLVGRSTGSFARSEGRTDVVLATTGICRCFVRRPEWRSTRARIVS